MKVRQQFWRWLGCLVLIWAIFIGWSGTAHAAALSNGVYQVPIKIIKADSNATSSANPFFTDSAVARVQDQQTTLLITSNGAQYIKSMKISGQPVTKVKAVNQQTIYQVNLTGQTSPLTTTFSLTTPLGAMNETARLALDWEKAQRLSTTTTTSELLDQTTILADTAKSSSQASSQDKSSQQTTPATTTKTSTAQTAKIAKATAKTEYWRYQVLQGTKMKKSEADQYYTDLAKVTPTKQGYRVTLTVKYAKSLKLGSRAVVPESINRMAPQQVSYGQTTKAYTMQYSFMVANRQDLASQLIPGKIHVTVPVMSISETFPIRFRFASSGSADQTQAATVAALPKTTEQATTATAPSTMHHASAKATLPKTGEQQSSWSMLGWLGLIACGYVLGGEQREAAD